MVFHLIMLNMLRTRARTASAGVVSFLCRLPDSGKPSGGSTDPEDGDVTRHPPAKTATACRCPGAGRPAHDDLFLIVALGLDLPLLLHRLTLQRRPWHLKDGRRSLEGLRLLQSAASSITPSSSAS